MSKQVKEVLWEQKVWHDNVMTRFEPQEGFENLVFTGKTNRPLNASNIKYLVNYLIGKINRQNPESEFAHLSLCLRAANFTSI